MAWSEAFLKVLKDNDVRLVTYVPDNVLTPLIAGVIAASARRTRDPALTLATAT